MTFDTRATRKSLHFSSHLYLTSTWQYDMIHLLPVYRCDISFTLSHLFDLLCDNTIYHLCFDWLIFNLILFHLYVSCYLHCLSVCYSFFLVFLPFSFLYSMYVLRDKKNYYNSFSYCQSTAFLPVRPHCTTPDEADAKKILTAAPSENWRPLGRPHTMWMKTIQQDLKSNNLSLNEAINVAENHPLWRLMSMFGATQC